MRKTFLLGAAVLMSFAASALADDKKPETAQTGACACLAGPIDPRVSRAIAVFQRNNDVAAFKATIASLIARNPSLGCEIVAASAKLSIAGRNASAQGLAEGWAKIATSNPERAALVKASVDCADESYRSAYNAETAALTGEASAGNGQGNNGNGGNGNGGTGNGGNGIGGGGGQVVSRH